MENTLVTTNGFPPVTTVIIICREAVVDCCNCRELVRDSSGLLHSPLVFRWE